MKSTQISFCFFEEIWICWDATETIEILILAPQVGLEPTTLRLTAECSAIELLRSVRAAEIPYPNYHPPGSTSKPRTSFSLLAIG